MFTGYDEGLSDLFVVNADGSNLHRLTHDKYADLQPSWSPDGKTIAFATDRGPATNFDDLKFGNMRIALYHLDKGTIELLDHMDDGRNINPVWAPDGRSLAFVSDRSGISNLFLYDFTDKNIYQLTNVYTGVSGITPLSPCLSWAHEADRLRSSEQDTFLHLGEARIGIFLGRHQRDHDRDTERQRHADDGRIAQRHEPPGVFDLR